MSYCLVLSTTAGPATDVAVFGLCRSQLGASSSSLQQHSKQRQPACTRQHAQFRTAGAATRTNVLIAFSGTLSSSGECYPTVFITLHCSG